MSAQSIWEQPKILLQNVGPSVKQEIPPEATLTDEMRSGAAACLCFYPETHMGDVTGCLSKASLPVCFLQTLLTRWWELQRWRVFAPYVTSFHREPGVHTTPITEQTPGVPY